MEFRPHENNFDETQTARERRFHSALHFLGIFSVAVLIACIIIFVASFTDGWDRTSKVVLAIAVCAVIGLALVKLRRRLTASILTILYLTFGTTYLCYPHHGIHDISMLALPMIILTASTLFGPRLFVVFGSLPLIIMGFITYLRHVNGLREGFINNALQEYIIFSAIYVVTMIGIRLITNYEHESLEKAIKNEIKFRSIFENIQDVYYEHSLNGDFTEISPSVKNVIGYSRSYVLGMNLIGFFADKAAGRRFVDGIVGKGRVRNKEVALLNSDSRIIYCLINARVIHDAAKNPVRVVGSLRDVTKYKERYESGAVPTRTSVK